MNLKHIRERMADGFKPFVIETSTGRRYKVMHRDFIAVGKSVALVLGRNDSVTRIDAAHISAIMNLPTGKRR